MRNALSIGVTGLFVLAAAAMPATQITINSNTASTMQMGGPAPTTPMPRGTGMIGGTAVDANGNRPIAGAIVTLTMPGTDPLRMLADTQGQFAFRDLLLDPRLEAADLFFVVDHGSALRASG